MLIYLKHILTILEWKKILFFDHSYFIIDLFTINSEGQRPLPNVEMKENTTLFSRWYLIHFPVYKPNIINIQTISISSSKNLLWSRLVKYERWRAHYQTTKLAGWIYYVNFFRSCFSATYKIDAYLEHQSSMEL